MVEERCSRVFKNQQICISCHHVTYSVPRVLYRWWQQYRTIRQESTTVPPPSRLSVARQAFQFLGAVNICDDCYHDFFY